MSQPFYEQKLALLKQRQEQLLEEYAAVQAQMGRALGEVEMVRLRRQAEHTEQVLLRNEQEQAEVSRLLDNAAASPPGGCDGNEHHATGQPGRFDSSPFQRGRGEGHLFPVGD